MGSVISSFKMPKKRISLCSTRVFFPYLLRRCAAYWSDKPFSGFTPDKRISSSVSRECHWLIGST